MSDLSTVSTDLFNKIRSRFSNIKTGDEGGISTSKPEDARFFDFKYTVGDDVLGTVNIQLDDKKLTVIYEKEMYDNYADETRSSWFDFLKDLRQFARKNRLRFDTRDIEKSNLDKRDYQYLAQNSGESKMSESKLFGTSKTSYQDMGEATIIVKHTKPVNYNVPAGRTQHIDSIYIESNNGERFRYPHRHLNGARAMARHIANGGTAYDSIGTYISGLSEELSKLRQFKNYTQRSGVMSEALGDLTEQVIERIEAVKEEIANLQKQSHYEEFSQSFQPKESLEVPEDVMNGWVDALTIRTFNEELKSVFPFIYRLVSEKTNQGLSYDDLVKEAGGYSPNNHPQSKDYGKGDDEEEDDEEDVKEHSLFSDFEEQMDDITTFDYDQVQSESEDDPALLEKLLEWLSEHGYAMTDDWDTEQAGYALLKLADALEKGKMGFKEIQDKVFEILPQGQWQRADFIKTFAPNKKKKLQKQPVEGNEFAQKVQALKAKGAKPGTKFTTSDGQEHTLKDAIELAGLTVEDFWTEDELQSEQSSGISNEIIEFITSMYDSESGTFPRGEEGVKIAVEKKFGEQAGQFANFVVEKLSMKNEIAPVIGAIAGTAGRALAGAAGRAAIGAVAKPAVAAGGAALKSLVGDDEDEDEDDLEKKESSEIASIRKLAGLVK